MSDDDTSFYNIETLQRALDRTEHERDRYLAEAEELRSLLQRVLAAVTEHGREQGRIEHPPWLVPCAACSAVREARRLLGGVPIERLP